MSTNATIAVAHGPVIKAITVHWDGYPEWTGKILQDHFPSDQANALVALGNLSSLGPKLVPTENSGHTAMTPENGVCVFYGRDLGESNSQFNSFESVDDLFHSQTHSDFYYLMADGQWFVSDGNKGFVPLTQVLENG